MSKKVFTPSESCLLLSAITLLSLLLFNYSNLSYMNMDGSTYATIARNMADGIGNLKQPVFSDTHFRYFNEHPSLGIWFQSLFFKLAGDHYWVERLFSSIVMLANLTIFYLLTQQAINWGCHQPRLSRTPLLGFVCLIYAILPKHFHYEINNSLETLAGCFAFCGLYLLLNSYLSNKSSAHSILAGILVAISTLINGPLTLFVFAAYPILYLLNPFKHVARNRYGYDLSLFTVSYILSFMVILWMADAQFQYLHFLYQQVLASIAATRTDSIRPLIIDRVTLFSIRSFDMLSPLILSTALYALWLVRQTDAHIKQTLENIAYHADNIAFYCLLSLAASLPIILSAKLSQHYLLQTQILVGILWCTLLARVYAKSLSLIALIICLIPLSQLLIKMTFYGTDIAAKELFLRNSSIDYDNFKQCVDELAAAIAPRKNLALHAASYPTNIGVLTPLLARHHKINIEQANATTKQLFVTDYYYHHEIRTLTPAELAKLNKDYSLKREFSCGTLYG